MAKGFTFIEVLLCLLLFGMGMLGALACQVYARQQVLIATQRLLATAAVTDVAASLQSVPQIAHSFQGQFKTTPAAIKLCQDVSICTVEQLLQSQLDRQLTVLIPSSGATLPYAQLCIVSGGAQPEIQLSWRGLVASKFTPKATLCPLPSGFFHVDLRAGAGS
ncbi:MAG: prepilin-type N-terminal cleavage/methylation domain-containing protein [Gammaproteobacteria bacterium]|nr:prepilin-type N-terminal cleavage/methylation domain-containing protein [Gammaproteobacteria bacterium]